MCRRVCASRKTSQPDAAPILPNTGKGNQCSNHISPIKIRMVHHNTRSDHENFACKPLCYEGLIILIQT